MNDENYSALYHELKEEITEIFMTHDKRLTIDNFENGTVFMQLARDLSNKMDYYKRGNLTKDEMHYLNFLISCYYETLLNALRENIIEEIKKNKKI